MQPLRSVSVGAELSTGRITAFPSRVVLHGAWVVPILMHRRNTKHKIVKVVVVVCVHRGNPLPCNHSTRADDVALHLMRDACGPWPVPFPSQIARWRHGPHQTGAYHYGAGAVIRVGADSMGWACLSLDRRAGDPRAWEKWIGVIACLLLTSFGPRARAGSVMAAPVALAEMSLDPPNDGGSARPRSFPGGCAIGRDDSDSFMMTPIDHGRRPGYAERVSGQLWLPLTLFSAAGGLTKLDILSTAGVPLLFWVDSGSFPSSHGRCSCWHNQLRKRVSCSTRRLATFVLLSQASIRGGMTASARLAWR